MSRPYLCAVLFAGAAASAGCNLSHGLPVPKPAPKPFANASLASPDLPFTESGMDPDMIQSLIPGRYEAVGFYSCSYKAANVRHDSDGNGVDFERGAIVSERRWGMRHDGCTISVGTVYNPNDPRDAYLANLKEGDTVNEWQFFLFSPEDARNYLTGNSKGHALCYPISCPPLVLEGEGVNGINRISRRNEYGMGRDLWKK